MPARSSKTWYAPLSLSPALVDLVQLWDLREYAPCFYVGKVTTWPTLVQQLKEVHLKQKQVILALDVPNASDVVDTLLNDWGVKNRHVTFLQVVEARRRKPDEEPRNWFDLSFWLEPSELDDLFSRLLDDDRLSPLHSASLNRRWSVASKSKSNSSLRSAFACVMSARLVGYHGEHDVGTDEFVDARFDENNLEAQQTAAMISMLHYFGSTGMPTSVLADGKGESVTLALQEKLGSLFSLFQLGEGATDPVRGGTTDESFDISPLHVTIAERLLIRWSETQATTPSDEGERGQGEPAKLDAPTMLLLSIHFATLAKGLVAHDLDVGDAVMGLFIQQKHDMHYKWSKFLVFLWEGDSKQFGRASLVYQVLDELQRLYADVSPLRFSAHFLMHGARWLCRPLLEDRKWKGDLNELRRLRIPLSERLLAVENALVATERCPSDPFLHHMRADILQWIHVRWFEPKRCARLIIPLISS